MSDLYVLQNHLGLIKIGQSRNLGARIRKIETEDLCSVAVIAIREGAGHLERTILKNLEPHKIIGEWHHGGDRARFDVARAVPLRGNQEWIFPLADGDSITKWLNRVEENRQFISHKKLYQEIIKKMTRHTIYNDMDFVTGKIWELICRYERREDWRYSVRSDGNGGTVLLSCNGEQLPRYTTDVKSALTLWPEGERPARWSEEDAWGCCIAALKARRRHWMENRRTEIRT